MLIILKIRSQGSFTGQDVDRPGSFMKLWGESWFPCLFQLKWLPVFLVLWPLPPLQSASLHFHFHNIFTSNSCVPLIRTVMMTVCWLNNPGWSLHLKNLYSFISMKIFLPYQVIQVQTVMLEKTLESLLDCKKIKPVSPKGNQPWIFIGRTDAESEAPIVWPPDAKNWLIGKDLNDGKDWKQQEKGATEEELVSPTQWAWVWANSGR